MKAAMPNLDELKELRQQGMERAASIWETLETSDPVHPVNIYKAACSIKCAEFMTRLRDNPAYGSIVRSLTQFLDGTLDIAIAYKEHSNKVEGVRVIMILEEAMPLTAEVFADPAAYAMRQHTYDGIIMLAAAKMGKEVETREVISKFQEGVVKATLLARFAENLASNGPIE